MTSFELRLNEPPLSPVVLMLPDPTVVALFLTELEVADWSSAVRWYEHVLGLTVELRDAEHGFALLQAGGGRIGLKQSGAPAREQCRLIFQVDDVDAAQVRLRERGVAVGPPSDNQTEGYRAIRLTDPEGTPITLFQWLRPPGRS